MKSKFFIAISAFLCVFIACNRIEPQQPEEDEIIDVPLRFVSGDIEFTTENLTRAGSSNDIYLIQVDYYPKGSTTLTPFAYAVLDDVSNLSVKLVNGYSYVIEAALLKNGKNDFTAYSNLTEQVGFSGTRVTSLTNGFVSSTSLQLTPNSWYYTRSKDGYMYLHPYGEKYYGKTDAFEASKTSSVTVNMDYTSLQLVFNATNLTKGSIKIDNSTGRNDAPYFIPVVNLTPSSPTYSNYFWSGADGFVSATISYVDEEGMETLIYQGRIPMPAKKRMIVNITLSEDIDKTNSSIGFNLGDSTLEDSTLDIQQQ